MRRWMAIPAAILAVGWMSDRAVGSQGTVEGVIRLAGTPRGGAVVWLIPEDGTAARARPEPALIDQRKLRFEPTVVAVEPGAEVAFRNSDPLLHNIFSPETIESFDLGTYPEGESRSHRFEQPGPHVILCNIHPEMEAYVIVVPTPYHAVTDAEGRFRLEAPPGLYRLRAWHRRGGEVERRVTVPADGTVPVELRFGPAAGR